ncbi:MAG: histidine kinase [Firmicutes bacterium]|nr:histidine kinase [Bacillota bacterium]
MIGRNVFRRLSLKNKMLALIVVQIITVICIYSYSSYYISNKIIWDKTNENITLMLNAIKNMLDGYVYTIFDISQGLFYDSRIYLVGDTNKEKDEFKASMENLLKQSIVNVDCIHGIWLLNCGTEVKYIKAGYKTDIGIAVPQIREMLNQSDEKDTWYITGNENDTSGIYYCRNIYDPYTFKKIGNLIFQVSEKYFGEACAKYSGESMGIMLISKSNHFIYSVGADDVNIFASLAGYLRGKREITLNDNRNGIMVSSVVCGSNGWRIIAYSSFKDIYGDLFLFMVFIAFSCGFSIIIMFICNKYLRNELVVPINVLVSKMSTANHYDGIADEISHTNQNEFKIVFDSFNNMNKRIRTLIDQNYREKLMSTTAQIKALQAQINPHFIFNTLQSIQWLAHINNVPEIVKATEAMAKMIDAAIGRHDEMIPLQEELEHINSYVLITKLRFEDTVSFIKSIEPAALDILVPNLILQPIVENCIIHGKSSKKIVVKLSVKIQGETVVIIVEDDGKGMEQTQTDELNRCFTLNNDEYFSSYGTDTGIGLENVNRRIKLIYGEKYGIFAESVQGEYTRFIITVAKDLESE